MGCGLPSTRQLLLVGMGWAVKRERDCNIYTALPLPDLRKCQETSRLSEWKEEGEEKVEMNLACSKC